MRLELPEVLREEPRYRLLFAGQVLSVSGDRITFIALPFAVLAIGDLGDLALVTVIGVLAALACLAVPAVRRVRRPATPAVAAYGTSGP